MSRDEKIGAIQSNTMFVNMVKSIISNENERIGRELENGQKSLKYQIGATLVIKDVWKEILDTSLLETTLTDTFKMYFSNHPKYNPTTIVGIICNAFYFKMPTLMIFPSAFGVDYNMEYLDWDWYNLSDDEIDYLYDWYIDKKNFVNKATSDLSEKLFQYGMFQHIFSKQENPLEFHDTDDFDELDDSDDYNDGLSEEINGHKYVDLGLPSGRLWANCNVGAEEATESGFYFSWGETQPKRFYLWSSYLLGVEESENEVYITKYCTIDHKTILEAEDDAATTNWGPMWKTPTVEDQQELIDGCEWETTQNFRGTGVAGQIGVSKYNGNIIFFPTCGHKYMGAIGDAPYSGYYWLSSHSGDLRAHCFANGAFMRIKEDWRFRGMNIRAVVKV